MADRAVRVDLDTRSYDILIADALNGVGPAVAERLRPTRLALLADDTVAPLYAEAVRKSCRDAGLAPELVPFPAGEGSKRMEIAELLCRELHRLGLDRKSAILALGGGVTGDLAGFVAAVFMRGIPFVQIPTTILAMVDSSVGGKTGVNLPEGKNLVGAFHQPALVYAATGTLATLSARERSSGLAEAVKHGVIRDPEYLDRIEHDIDALQTLDGETMAALVAGSCRIKAGVVAADEREGGVRAILNFGHTVGHAIEALAGYGRHTHGEAVSIGMAAAMRMGEALLGFPVRERERVEAILERLSLPTRFTGIPTEAVLRATLGDKKAEGGSVRFVLPRRIGEVEIVPLSDQGPVRDAVEAIREGD